jgi:hypothetical protein
MCTYSVHRKHVGNVILGRTLRLTPLIRTYRTNLASSLKLCSDESKPSTFIRAG